MPDESDTATLKLTYDGLCQERDRLRDARAAITRQLGPLPLSAAIAFGIVSGFSKDVEHRCLLFVALAAFVLMVGVSALYSGFQPYRQLRAQKESRWRSALAERFPDRDALADELGLQLEDVLPERDWYSAMIELERAVYGPPQTRNRGGPPRRAEADNLQLALDRERTGLYIVQFLFVVTIVLLVLSRLL